MAKKRTAFLDDTKELLHFHHSDGYIDHSYTNEAYFKTIASEYGLRNYYVNGTYHFNRHHPWLFDLYCMVAKKNGTSDTALNPVYHIRDYMRKIGKIIMPIDLYLIGETNIDGTPLCDGIKGVGKSSPSYVKCNRKKCTCYNPFRGRDFRSVITKIFYKHLSVSEYRDVDDTLRIGYVFSKDSNPNCVNCRGAKGVCPCKDNYRNALLLRDSPSVTAVTQIYVMGVDQPDYRSENYHIHYIEDLDSFVSGGSSLPWFCVRDGNTLWDYERTETFIRQFRNSIKIYSFSNTMFDTILKPDDAAIQSLFTAMNLFLDDEKPFERSEVGSTDDLNKKLTRQLKLYEDAIRKKKKETNSLIRKKNFYIGKN